MPRTRYSDLLICNFVLSYTFLAQLKKTGSGKQVKESLDHFFSMDRATDSPITPSDGVRTDEVAIKSLRQRVRYYSCFDDTLDLEQATTLLSTLILELAAKDLALIPTSELPSPTRIPFSSLMNLPPIRETHDSPSSGNGNIPFGLCHLDKIVSLDFLSSGQWMGYYSDQRHNLGAWRFDPSMRHIQFVARRAPKEELEADACLSECTKVDAQSRGSDAIGAFSLQSRVQNDGYIYMIKRYLSDNTCWTWRARMTPFGIVGV